MKPAFTAALEGKIVSRDQIGQRVSELTRPLVMTNGVFDVLHRGHVSYLARARDLGAFPARAELWAALVAAGRA
mgnify:CR=1 FL=1